MKNITTIILLLSIFTLQGCLAVAVGAAAGSGLIATDRRTLGYLIEDENIEQKAKARLAEHPELSKSSHVSAISYNGILLIIGQTPSLDYKNKIGEVMRSVANVKAFHNELKILGKSSLGTRSSDSYITTKIKTRMTFEKNFSSTHIKVITENGEVFLMGLVTREEANKAIAITKRVDGVQKVINVFEYI